MISKEDIEKDFLSSHYQEHNEKRLQHLASLKLPIEGKSVLEVGAGIGCHTKFFLDRNCDVVSTDARIENLSILKSRHPKVTTVRVDLDKSFDLRRKFDVVYCYGTLYHLSRPFEALVSMSKHCDNLLLLETCVSFEGMDRFIDEDKQGASQSFSGIGCRSSRKWLWFTLLRFYDYVYTPKTQPDHPEFPIDWSTGSKGNHLTRSVFIASRKELKNELLSSELLMKQERL